MHYCKGKETKFKREGIDNMTVYRGESGFERLERERVWVVVHVDKVRGDRSGACDLMRKRKSGRELKGVWWW